MSGNQIHPTAAADEDPESAMIAADEDDETEPLLPTTTARSTISAAASSPPDIEAAVSIRITEKLQGISVSKSTDIAAELKVGQTIYRVLPTVRQEDPAAYDPKIIAIGPFHRSTESLRPAETLKWQFLRDLLARSPHNSSDTYTAAAAALKDRARFQYAGAEDDDDAAFVEMLVLDGCFVIELMLKLALGERPEQLYGVNWILPLVKSDTLLAENQIPFFVLEALYEKTKIGAGEISLKDLSFIYVTVGARDIPADLRRTEFYHLLHVLQWSLRPGIGSKSAPAAAAEAAVAAPWRRWLRATKKAVWWVGAALSAALFWVVSCLFVLLLLRWKKQRRGGGRVDAAAADQSVVSGAAGSKRAPRMIPSATELQAAGVVFRRKKSSSSPCFLDVSFDGGMMEMPRLSVQGGSSSQFRNLIAFEQCCPGAGNHFTAYTMFMDYLVNTAADVAALEECGVVESKLGSSKEVVTFFNTICRGGYLDYDEHYLVGVFRDVTEYCQKDRHRWRAMLISTYFSSPWALISFLAAFLAIALTILSTFYSVYAYYHPPS